MGWLKGCNRRGPWAASAALDKASPRGLRHGLKTVSGVKFSVYVVEMIAQRMRCDAQLQRDVL